ncbi:MAG TPA: hypothetical protein VF788_04115, partial [Pseudonocardiaceae bacterium]
TVITSGGNRKPVKLDLGAGGRERLRRINTACPSLPSMDATEPSDLPTTVAARSPSAEMLSVVSPDF